MTTLSSPVQNRTESSEILFAEFLRQAPNQPQRQATDQDGTIGAEWDHNGHTIQLELAAGATIAEWHTWNANNPPKEGPPTRYIDLTRPDTWPELLEQLQW